MTDRPTHLHGPSGSAVYPAGHNPSELEELPADYWDAADHAHAVAAIKAEAARQIEEIAPLWKQLNDLHEPDSEGAKARRAQIQAIRQWSNDEEGKLK